MDESRRFHKNAFTVIELLVVVMIIAVILGILLPVGKTAFEKMRIHEAQTDLAKLELALEGYQAKYGEYPNSYAASGFTELVPVSQLLEFMAFPGKRVISNIFYDPWNIPYYYAEPGLNHPDFVDMASAGPDRLINANWKLDENIYGASDPSDENDDNINNWSRKR
ncbi:MAG: type II secretion system protein GspG [Chlamydiae bacterium]|nr:type II secretion system protein GspG [Chlamydiota bacterium]MBI3265781.1 type II secretion system protein GspG [Chlamydiota bacterium]